MFQLKSKGRNKNPMFPTQTDGRNSLSLSRVSTFLFHSDLQKTGRGRPTLGRAFGFTRSTNSSVNVTQRHPTDTPRVMCDQVSGYFMAQSGWHTNEPSRGP